MSHCSIALASTLLMLAGTTHAQVTPNGKMLRYPDVSETHVVFAYANDLWIAPREGGTASPLASPPGGESFPRFSPDGSHIAFIGNYQGDRDLYTISTQGGIPHRVTHNPTNEILCDWTADQGLIFYANGMAGLARQTQLFTVDPAGGMPEKLPVPYGANGAISSDGQWLAYTPHTRDQRTWKRYRGGMATDIWLFNLKTSESKKITDFEGTDSLPMWHGDTVYYLSDGGDAHRLNIWAYNTKNDQRRQVTSFTEYDVKWPSIGPGERDHGEIVFQNGSSLYLVDLKTSKTQKLEITIPGDRASLAEHTVNASKMIQSYSISATGKRAAVQARGDVWSLPAENGSPRNLTHTSGIAERTPDWSPDGKWIAYFSDATGEYELYITQSDGQGETKQLTSDNGPFKYNITWSPDTKMIAFQDKTGAIFIHTIESQTTERIDVEPWANIVSLSWSHDNRWLTYQRQNENALSSAVYLYQVEDKSLTQVTSNMFNARNPVFDREGDFLYYAADLSFTPTYSSMDLSFIYKDSGKLLAVPLRDDVERPWAPKSDEESWDADDDKDDKAEDDDNDSDENADADDEGDGLTGSYEGTVTGEEGTLPPGGIPFTLHLTLNDDGTVTGSISSAMGAGELQDVQYDPESGKLSFTVTIADSQASFDLVAKDGSIEGTVSTDDGEFQISASRLSDSDEDAEDSDDEKDDTPLEIDMEGFEHRAILLPVSPGGFSNLAVNNKNQLLYVRQGAGIKLFDISDDKKEEKAVASGGGFAISGDGKKILVSSGTTAKIMDAKSGATGKALVTKGMSTSIDPRAEWKQLFTDAWRIQRDFFYVSNMHGVDWNNIKELYEPMLEDCVTREDVSYVIREMISELNIGHAYYFGGDVESQPSVNVGMLGCDFEVAIDDNGNTGLKIAKIYEGAKWDADARGPLFGRQDEIDVGSYILAVNGMPIDNSKDPWAAFTGTAGRTITLTVADSADPEAETRQVLIKPISSEGNLRYRAWIERNRKYVQDKSDGQIAYVYVPDTGINGQNNLFRQYYGQADSKAMIIDERWNGGGQIPTRFIELLNRPITNYWARRDGRDWPWPPDSVQGPKCMLINGLAGSGGDMFPALFRQANLGKIIGMRTWGGLVGISGNPGLIDGGYTAVPTFGFYESNGTWGIEGHGVDPDIQIIDDPALMVDGGDPQLDAAIDHMLEQIKLNPYTPPQRPQAPDRSGMGVLEQDK